MPTTIDQLEQVQQQVADWAIKTIMDVYRTIAPDGRGYNQVTKPLSEQVTDYAVLRGNPEAWAKYLLDLTESIEEKLQNAGLKPDEIMGVHPFDLACKLALEYSQKMEGHLASNPDKHPGALGTPILSRIGGSQGTTGNSGGE